MKPPLEDEEAGEEYSVHRRSAVTPQPTDRAYRYLLEFNMRTMNVAFGIEDDHIYARSGRRVEGLNEGEVEEMIEAVMRVVLTVQPILMQGFDVGAMRV